MKAIISIMLMLIISGCTDSNDLVRNRIKYTQWFSEHHQKLNEIVNKIYLHPYFMHIGVIPVEYKANYKKFNESDIEVHNEILEECNELGIPDVDIYREGKHLFSVRFTVLSEGFVFSDGYALFISYIPDEKYLEKVKNSPNYSDRNYYDLNIPKWYLVEYYSK